MKEVLNKTFITTKNTQLAAGLAALGVEFLEPAFSKQSYNGKEVVHWFFHTKGAMGMSTSQLIDAWYSDDWFEENYPKHPWSLVISGILTKEYLVSKIKDEPREMIYKKGDKIWSVFEGSEMEQRLKDV